MIRVIRLACLIALPLALAACGDKEPDKSATAAGEILEGSVSDAMLPIDTVRSQPPLAPKTQAAKAGGKKAGEEAGEEAPDAAASPADSTASPAAAPTIAAPPAPAPAPAAPAPKQ